MFSPRWKLTFECFPKIVCHWLILIPEERRAAEAAAGCLPALITRVYLVPEVLLSFILIHVMQIGSSLMAERQYNFFFFFFYRMLKECYRHSKQLFI